MFSVGLGNPTTRLPRKGRQPARGRRVMDRVPRGHNHKQERVMNKVLSTIIAVAFAASAGIAAAQTTSTSPAKSDATKAAPATPATPSAKASAGANTSAA